MLTRLIARIQLHLGTLYRPDLARRILNRFPEATDALAADDRELLRIRGMSAKSLEKLRGKRLRCDAEEQIQHLQREGARVHVRGWNLDDGLIAPYPRELEDLPEMAALLFSKGHIERSARPAVGIIGSRAPSAYGRRQARIFSAALARQGVTIVSGLARGIDGESHEASLKERGRTIAVLGSGLGRIYPLEHSSLARRIVETGGLLVSEFPWRSPPRSWHFPQRNRVLSGLSNFLFVVEASLRSGSLITVDWALRQGKTVYALPGRVDQKEAEGVLRLIRDGAIPALEPADLLSAFGLEAGGQGKARRDERRVGLSGPLGADLTRLFSEDDILHADEITDRLEAEPAEILRELSRLDIEGELRRSSSGGYELCD